MLILPTGEKSLSAETFAKYLQLWICAGRCRGLSPVYSPASEDTLSLININCRLYRWYFLLLAQAGLFLHCFFPSSSLTCTVFVSSAPCRHMNHCFIAGAAKQLAPLLRQYACSIACKAGSPAEKATAGFCDVPAVISGSAQSFQPLHAKTAFEKKNTRAGPEKTGNGHCCFTLMV